MAAQADDERMRRFEVLFEAPTIPAMLALSPGDFELFIKYVFECAGYTVHYVGDVAYPEGPGADQWARVWPGHDVSSSQRAHSTETRFACSLWCGTHGRTAPPWVPAC
jgi:hypothetical protein